MVALYLASTSPARAQILKDVGLAATIIAPEVDEEQAVGEMEAPHDAGLIALHLAQLKAESVLAPDVDGLVIGGDSVFEFGGEFLGKPHTPETAIRRWMAMRGNSGILHSGLWVIDHTGGQVQGAAGEVSHAHVHFRDDISDSEIADYVATGEPLEVAGAFTLDAKGAAFIDKIEGDSWAVVGMSARSLRSLIRSLGHDYTSLWDTPRSPGLLNPFPPVP
jgi:septum formation protein